MADKDDDDDRDRIDLLAEEFAARLRRGESPSLSEFAQRETGDADEVRALLASVAMIEQWKRRKVHERDLPGGGRTPEHLGDFRILRELGRGGMGIVYEAEQTSLGRHVAVKVLPRHSLLDPTRWQRFQHEAQTAARLHHTNIVPIFGAGEDDGLHYIVMQLIDGRGIDRALKDWKREPDLPDGERWARVARIGVQAAEALEYAHGQGVLHRDIKPANLLLDGHGVVWVTDFGLAKMVERESLSNSGDIIGTLQYMAPERFETEADARSDVYSLGLTLYELLTLEPAFQESSPSKLIQRVCEGEPPRPRKRNPAIPRDLETIVLKAIARSPAHRYQTAGDLAEDLTRYLDDRPVRARRVSSVERLARWCRRNRAVAALSATVLLSLLLAAAVGWAGYAGTTRALRRESLRRDEAEKATRRAEENVALSLRAIEDLFNRLSPRDLDPPDRLGPGPGPEHDPSQGPPPPPRGGPFPHDPLGLGPPGMPPPHNLGERPSPEDEADLLQSVLLFYEQFAAKNAGHAHLEREAARAYRRVGDIQRRLGEAEASENAFRRAAELFETQVKHDPANSGLQYELAAIYAKSEPVSDEPEALARAERFLRRGLTLSESLGPEVAESSELRARLHRNLGRLLNRMDQTEDAESNLRRALAIEASLASQPDYEPFHRLSLIDARQSLADFLGDHGRKEEARALLLQCRDDLDTIGPESPPDRAHERALNQHRESLAISLEAIGESALADLISSQTRQARPAPPPRHPGVFGPGPEGPPPRPHGPPSSSADRVGSGGTPVPIRSSRLEKSTALQEPLSRAAP